MHLTKHRMTRRTFVVAALGGSILVAGLAPAHAEPEGTPVPAFRAGVVAAWGDNGSGQATVPTRLEGKSVIAVSAGGFHNLALTSDGVVTAWGESADHQTDVPDSLDGETVTAVAAGFQHSLALTSDGQVTAWGNPSDDRTVVPDSLDGKTVTAIAAGGAHSLALTSDGRITGWGWDDLEQTAPPPSLDAKTVVAIAAGTDHSLALTSEGTVVGFGWGDFGQTDVPDSLDSKIVVAIAAGETHSLALTSDGDVVAWGAGDFGQQTVPDVLVGRTVTAISAGAASSFALTSAGQVVAWGDPRVEQSALPEELNGRIVTAIAGGAGHALAVTTDFAAEGKPLITGDPVLGGAPLTATPSRYTATPDKISYQWFADGAPIIGATASTLHPAGSQLGKRISVQVTAILDGFPNVVTTSDPTGPVVRPGQNPTGTAPTIKLDTTSTTVRRGQAATLSWTSSNAATMVASGGWSGPLAASGTAQVKPTTLGVTTYVLTATNAAGSTTAQVQVTVTRPAKRLKVTVAKGQHRAGGKVKVTVRGLEAGEKYTIRVGKKKIGGTSKSSRSLVRSIPLPRASGRATIRVTGDQADRKGAVKVRVVRR